MVVPQTLEAPMALVFLVVLLLLAPAIRVAGQEPQKGFLSIDCGLDDKYSGRNTDERTGITYVSDGAYVDTGENLKVSAEYQRRWRSIYQTVRSFPSGVRNCYHLPTELGSKYLVRVVAAYGNHDGKNDSSLLKFKLHLGTNFWNTVYDAKGDTYEAVFFAWASWAPVCLLNTNNGAPFLSFLELRKLDDVLYRPPLTASKAMTLFGRPNLAGRFTQYPDDQYDRFWFTRFGPQWGNLSTDGTIKPDPSFMQPLPVLQTAIVPLGNKTTLSYAWTGSAVTSFMVFLTFADFQNTKIRQFDITLNGNPLGPKEKSYTPSYLVASTISNSGWYRASDNKYNLVLNATATSELPPMINAIEIYKLLAFDSRATYPKDFDAIMAIKYEYGVKKNWMGDPCFPFIYAWEGVGCTNTSDNTLRITSLDLSNSSLVGPVSMNFTLLTTLENLDLSYNKLNGSIPDSLTSLSSLRVLNLSGNHLSGDSLCKNYTGSLMFRYDSDGHNKCNIPSPPSPHSIPKVAIIAVSVVVPVLLLVILLLVYFICRERRRKSNNVQQVPTPDAARNPQVENDNPGKSRQSHVDHLPNIENRRFTYKELVMFTNNFERFIGQGGFGPVYYGRLVDNTEVAVKTRSESSSHGLDQFLAEVESLTKVHHRNIVSLIGYCLEKDHLALVYEYMSQGSLFDRLRGKKNVAGNLSWETRVRVVLEAAQGLDYLHKGCSPPIIHRDVKSGNILLGQNMRAKMADLGLSKTYLNEAQTHVSATAAGTAGYMDPQYYLTGRLTESSDVYSFGIVLLEVATGEPPMVPGYGHIVQRVKQMIATGDISSVADARLGGAYDVTSMWKLVDTAMLCTAESPAQRPKMATVVAQMKEGLALEEARQNDTSSGVSRGSDIPPIVSSTFRPMAR